MIYSFVYNAQPSLPDSDPRSEKWLKNFVLQYNGTVFENVVNNVIVVDTTQLVIESAIAGIQRNYEGVVCPWVVKLGRRA